MYNSFPNINELVNQVLLNIEIDNDRDRITFTTLDGKEYLMYHSPDCCESVNIDDICGDLDDLVNSPILMAEESQNTSDDPWPEGVPKPEYIDSYTWTFYRFRTLKGSVVIRWYGSSNGYYSESVTFARTK